MKTATINVFICGNKNKENITKKLSMFFGGKYTATGNVWYLNVPEHEYTPAINAIEYCLAGNNAKTETCGKNAIIVFNN